MSSDSKPSDSKPSDSKPSDFSIPANFRSVIVDFTCDLSVTFPEYAYLWVKWSNPNLAEDEIANLFEYCLSVYPERFFDILNQNEALFEVENNQNTMFFPDTNFKLLFNCANVSETTKKAIWKYLQLVLFTIVGGMKDKSQFGETMNLFDGIDETELQEKLAETMRGMTDFFKEIAQDKSTQDKSAQDRSTQDESDQDANPDQSSRFNPSGSSQNPMFDKMPDLSDLHENLKTMFDGKIGKLAKEMAEEISQDFSDMLGDDINNIHSTEDAMKKLMKDPKKIMNLMKTVGSKLDAKMKSGEVSREELMKEAGDLMGKMKEMGGEKQFQEMFKNMTKGMGGMGKNMKMDTNAMERMTTQQTTRERLLRKAEANKAAAAEKASALDKAKFSIQTTDSPNTFSFRLAEEGEQEKSFYIHPDLLADPIMKVNPSATKKKNKKGKK